MNLSPEHLKLFLQLAAVGQCCLAGVNLGLVPLMHWKDDLKRLPLLLREVFQVHLWFITITVGIFGTTTWRFAGELSTGGNSALVWLAGCIALFWGIRAVLQWCYYSSSHWRGHLVRTFIHILCTLGYGGLGLLYAIVWSGN